MKKTLLIILSVLTLNNAYGQVKATTAEINAGVDDDKFATALAMQGSKYTDQSGAKLYAVTAAGANTYTATINPAITAYSTGQVFFIKISTANTGASTLNLNGLGAKTLVKDAATALGSGDLLAGRIYAVAYDGANFQVVNIASAITGTNLNISGNGTIGGGLGVGSAGVFPHIGIYNSRTLSGVASGGTAYGLINGGAIQTDVTGGAIYNQTLGNTAAGSFTLPLLVHYNASQATLGAGSIVTSQIGYSAESTLIGATNNYGFYGAIPTGTNRYNLYMTGTAQNHLRGSTTFGGTTTPLGQLSIYPNDGTTKGLVIKAGASQSANLLEVQDAAGTPITSILGNGLLTSTLYFASPGVSNSTSNNSSLLALNNTGAVISRNIADNNPALSVNLANASSTGAIQRWQSSGTDVALMSKTGALTISGGVISAAPATSAGAYSLLTRNDATGIIEKVSASSLVSGASYIQNGTAQQASSNFNISGNGVVQGLGVGSAPITGTNFYNTKNITGAVSAFGQQINATVQSDVTSTSHGIQVSLGTQAAAFTAADVVGFRYTQGTLGSGSSITRQRGILIGDLTNGTSNFGLESQVSAGTNKYNLYLTGTAQNYLAGNTSVGTQENLGALTVRPTADGTKGVLIKGFSPTQSAVLLEIQKSDATSVFAVSQTGGLTSTRDIADGNATAIINNNNVANTGPIIQFQSGGTGVALIGKTGVIRSDLGLTNLTSGSNNAFVNTGSNGTVISRNIADANPALVVNLGNASSTGAIQKWQSNSADVASISKLGVLTMSGGVLSTAPTTSAGAFNFLTRNDATGAIEKTKPTTLAEFGITDKLSRFVALTTSGTSSDINYWTKIATINLGSVDHREVNLQLGFASASGSWGSAIVDLGVRQYVTGQMPALSISILSAGQMSNWMTDDSFKIVNEGYGTNFDVYLKKGIAYGSFRIFEMLAHSSGGNITYLSNQGWSATEPTGTYTASTSGIKYRSNNIYHSGNNNVLNHVISGFTTGANTTVTASDNIKSAVEKLQGQVSSKMNGRMVVTDFDTPTGNGIIEAGAATTTNQPVSGQWGTGIQFSTNNNPAYAHQLIFTTSGDIYNRNKPGTTFSSWSKMVTSANYNTYSPALSGTGATGTWGIGISGNAATATTLATARTINGVAFNGSANITITDATREPVITAGTSAQYQRGDKTWQTLNTTAVPEGTNQYFSTTRVLNTTLTGFLLGYNSVLATDNILTAVGKLQGQVYNKAADADVIHKTGNETMAGSLGIGLTGGMPSGYKLAVGGNLIAEAIKVKPQGQWPDYVFEKNYPKLTLAEVEDFITKNKHLPDVPSAAEVKKEGIDVGEMNAKLLKKIEELTLYMIEKDKQVRKLSETVEKLQQEVKSIKKE